MKSIQIEKYGGSEVLEIKDIPEPEISENKVLVDNFAASINPFDRSIFTGLLKNTIKLNFPFVLGGDIAGIVKKVGKGVAGFNVGDEVYGSGNVLNGGSGAFAESVSVSPDRLALKPKTSGYEEAAGLVLTGVSALQAIKENIKLQSGQKILIHGGAGGIGHLALQMAVAIGAHVSVTVSTGDIEFVKKLGATGIVDYKKHDFEKILKEYDAVFDTVGGNTTDKSIAVLRRGGILNIMSGQPDMNLVNEAGIVVIRQKTDVNAGRLSELSRIVDSGKVRLNIDRIFPLTEIRDAFDYYGESSPQGKIILKIK